MSVRVARIQARSTTRMTRAEVQAALFGRAPHARILWELPGPQATSWLVQVPSELAGNQLRRFAQLRIAADVVGFRRVDAGDSTRTTKAFDPMTQPGARLEPGTIGTEVGSAATDGSQRRTRRDNRPSVP
jgi:hypothetical protein